MQSPISTVLSVVLLLASCATAPTQQVYWVNPMVEERLQQSRYTLDSTECTARAVQFIPEPSTPAPNAVEAGYQRAQRERERREYLTACMISRGWEQRTWPPSG